MLASLTAPSPDDPPMTAAPVTSGAGPGADAERPGSSGRESAWDRVATDPIANGAAILVLGVMVASLALIPILIRGGSLRGAPVWLVPALAAVGLGVAAYMAVIEVTAGQAVCGPLGDCNAVQRSEYARLAGIPIGVLGLAAYVAVLVAWAVSRIAGSPVAEAGCILVAGIALGGTVFSVYLTFLEPFVIGATCMWCLTSALTITGLAWATAGTGWAAIHDVRARYGPTA